MKVHLRVLLIYTVAISVVILGMRPYLSYISKIPVYINWNMNSEEEEEHKKNKNGEDGQEKILKSKCYHYLFDSDDISQNSLLYSKIKTIYISSPTPPPKG